MSAASSMSVCPPVPEIRHHPVARREKPWLQCPIAEWEAFFCERSNEKLIRAAGIAHDDAEWTQVYRACLEETKDGDVKTLMRLIYAQTRTINAGASNYMFTRVVETTEFVEPKSGVQENIVQWSRNQDPCADVNDDALPFTPVLPEGYVKVVECDSVSIASGIRDLTDLEDENVALICACTSHPSSDVLWGGLNQEEELYRRSDIERHTKTLLDGSWVYPFQALKIDEGRALHIEGVSCYRADRNFGYRLRRNTAIIDVVLSAPRKDPMTNGRTYMRNVDREHMYLTLRAAVSSAAQANCKVLVLSDFG
jgi:hypothetical protein